MSLIQAPLYDDMDIQRDIEQNSIPTREVARLFPYVLLTFVLVWLWDYAKVAVAFVGAHWVIVLVLVIVGFGAYGAYGAYLEAQEKKNK